MKDLLFEAFCYGVDYGQLLMEEERESEELFDAGICSLTGEKYSTPSSPTQRRQVHSEEWFEAKRESYKNFLKLNKYAKSWGN